MLVILSPAKIVNFKPQTILREFTIPEFLDHSQLLMKELRKLKPKDIANLMKVNNSIAELNYHRYITWSTPFTTENAKQAVLAFNGEVYHGLMATTLTNSDFAFAQDHLRILSGLYGVLRPFDLIQPYRLEMGSKLKVPGAATIYKFWGDQLTLKLNSVLKTMKKPVLINLSSAEYSKVIQIKKLKAPVISMEFWEAKGGDYKTIVVYTKKARGMMARFVIKHRLSDPEDLKGFDEEGYMFNPRYSNDLKWVYTRN